MQFQGDSGPRELALALGVQEVRPVDLVTAYGTLANGGKEIPHTTILAIKDTQRQGRPQPPYVPPAGKQVVSPQAAFIVTDILAGNTNPNVNPFWGKFSITGPAAAGRRRSRPARTTTPRTSTPTATSRRRRTPAAAAGAYALAVGVWNGNSDNSLVSTPARPLFSIDVSTYVWQGFLKEATAKWPITNFERRPTAWSGSRSTRSPASPRVGQERGQRVVHHRHRAQGPLGPDTCGIDVVVGVDVETGFDSWMKADRDWLRRAERGPGVAGGPNRTRTAYFYNGLFHPYGRVLGRRSSGGKCGGRARRRRATSCPTPDPSGVTPSFAAPTPTAPGPRHSPARPPARPRRRQRGAVGRTVDAATERAATADADTDAEPDADADPDAHTDADPGSRPTPQPRAAVPARSRVTDVGRHRRPRSARSGGPDGRSSARSTGRSARASAGSSSARTGRARRPCCRRSGSSCGRRRGPSTSSGRATAGSIRASCGGGSAPPAAPSRRRCGRPDAGHARHDRPARRHRTVVARLHR